MGYPLTVTWEHYVCFLNNMAQKKARNLGKDQCQACGFVFQIITLKLRNFEPCRLKTRCEIHISTVITCPPIHPTRARNSAKATILTWHFAAK
jgi:hypothetical protein